MISYNCKNFNTIFENNVQLKDILNGFSILSDIVINKIDNISGDNTILNKIRDYGTIRNINDYSEYKCPSTSENYGGSYRLKAGLITADDLALAGESLMVVGNSYLNPGDSEMWYWSMTPADFSFGYAHVWIEYAYLYGHVVGDRGAVRPVINVTTENGFTSGDGSVSSPYVID